MDLADAQPGSADHSSSYITHKQDPGLGKLTYLPSELRDKVYRYVCGYRKISISNTYEGLRRKVFGSARVENGLGTNESPNTFNRNILLVSKLFSEEITLVLYSTSLFFFTNSFYVTLFCGQISTAHRELITTVWIQLPISTRHTLAALKTANALLELPNLRHLRVSIVVGSDYFHRVRQGDKFLEGMNQSTKFPKLERATISLEYCGLGTERHEGDGGFPPCRCFKIVCDILGLTLPESLGSELDDDDDEYWCYPIGWHNGYRMLWDLFRVGSRSLQPGTDRAMPAHGIVIESAMMSYSDMAFAFPRSLCRRLGRKESLCNECSSQVLRV